MIEYITILCVHPMSDYFGVYVSISFYESVYASEANYSLKGVFDLALYVQFCSYWMICVKSFSNCPSLTFEFSFLSGGIYNFTPTPRRSERGRRKRERKSAPNFERLHSHNSLVYFDLNLTWFLRMYVLGDLER